MEKQTYLFSGKKVDYYFDESLSALKDYTDSEKTILVVDDKIAKLHGEKIEGWKTIIVEGDEQSKSLDCFQKIVDELIRLEADRSTFLVGIGGGVVTDLTGFVASVYMRGIDYGFVPSTLLAQVDASVGGKNGINYDRYKNILGIIRQPKFLLFDYDLLDTLEQTEIYNGFAEIIKYACFWDKKLFAYLENNKTGALERVRKHIAYVVRRSVEIKNNIVQEDEHEGGVRRLLNFGHTIGHAVEKLEQIPHGQAVAKGMYVATLISSELTGFPEAEIERTKQLIESYGLPTKIESQPEDIEELFKMDKKRESDFIHFILLNKIGKAQIKPVTLVQLSELLNKIITPQ